MWTSNGPVSISNIHDIAFDEYIHYGDFQQQDWSILKDVWVLLLGIP